MTMPQTEKLPINCCLASVCTYGAHRLMCLQIHLGLRVWKPYATWKPVSEELIKDALEIVLDVNTHPIMVMCSLVLNRSSRYLTSFHLQIFGLSITLLSSYITYVTPYHLCIIPFVSITFAQSNAYLPTLLLRPF